MTWLISILAVLATLISPLLAVQVQKFIERYNSKKELKINVFTQLMATRSPSAKLSNEHVRALNMIDLAFYGKIRKGHPKRTSSEQDVLNLWKEYFAHLSSSCPDNETGSTIWNQTSHNLFLNLLSSMAKDIGYDFDRVHLQNAIYSPIAHGDLEKDQFKIRKGLAAILAGEQTMKVELTSSANEDKNQ